MEFISNYLWEKNARNKNEDSLMLRHVKMEGKDYLLAVVCDGIGGLPEGENASSFVADGLSKELIRLLEKDRSMSMKKWRNAFLRKIYQCHRMVGLYGKEKGIRLGTTLSMIFLCEKRGWMFQVGDSAIFTGEYKLKRKTGVHRTKKGALKQAIGIGSELKVEYKRLYIRRGMVLLLASDGFYQREENLLTDRQGIRDLRKKSISEVELGVWLRNRYRESCKKGEKDNASAVCVVYRK